MYISLLICKEPGSPLGSIESVADDMVNLVPILVRGSVDQPLKYPLQQVVDITRGEWQVALSTITFRYHSKSQHEAVIPRKVLKVTSNQVMTHDVNDRNEVIYTAAVLSTVYYGGKHSTETTIGFKNQNFYTVNNPLQELELKLSTIDKGEFVTGGSVFVLLLFRRVR